jgi:hypothetical protein
MKRLQNVSFVFSLSLFFRIKQLFCPVEQTSSKQHSHVQDDGRSTGEFYHGGQDKG